MSRFSRSTVIAAIEVHDSTLTQADTSRLLLKLGQEINDAVSGEGVSVRKRMNDLIQFVDNHPGHPADDGPLEMVIVEAAVALLPPDRAETPWSEPLPLPPIMNRFRRVLQQFRRVLQQDGFVVADGALRPALPADIGLPSIESELMQLLKKHGFSTPKGHLEQAFDAHTHGKWASANGQLRTFIDALLDEIAEKLDPSVRAVGSGQHRRAKLASLGFLSTLLNEWDDDGRGFINGLVRRLHPQGPHPGLSDEDDSTFRLHIVLLTAALLLRRYDRGRGQ